MFGMVISPFTTSEKSTMVQNFERELMPPRTAVGDTSVGTMPAPIFKIASEFANGRVFEFATIMSVMTLHESCADGQEKMSSEEKHNEPRSPHQ